MSSNSPSSDDPADDSTTTSNSETDATLWDTIRTRLPLLGSTDDEATVSSEYTENLKRFITPDRIEWHDDHARLGDVYTQTYYISNWPKEAQAHLLYELYTNPQLVFNASIHYNPLTHEQAIEKLVDIEETLDDKVHGEFSHLLPNVEAQEQTLEKIREMKVNVENDGQRLHEVAIYITVYTTQEDNLAKIDRLIQQDIREGGGRFGLSIERDLPDVAHLSSAPLGKNALDEYRRRSSQLLLDTAAATTFPLVDDTLIEESGVVVGFNLANETAIVLDIYERDNGYNKLVIGDLGSGKSFGEKQYLLRHRHRHPEDNIIIIDPMSGFEGVNEAIGGEHVKVDGSKTINPLEIQPTPDHILNSSDQIDPYRMKLDEVRWFFRRFFDSYLESQESVDELWAPLMRAVKKAYRDRGITSDPATHDNPSPTIKDVLENLQDIADNPDEYADSASQVEVENWEHRAVNLMLHLEPFREGNELDNLVGETDLEISSEKPTYIDLEAYEGSSQGQQSLMMKLVFSMVYEQIKETDKRTIVAMDEAHKIIDDTEEADHWEERFRHSRHHDLSIHLISQRFEDFFQSESGQGANEAAKSMADLCTIQQIHRVNDVNRPLAKEGLGLTDDHIDYIESAVAGEDDTRQYTTALLKVADKGHYGLKVVATDTEKDLIDFDPSDLHAEDTTVGNDRIEHALKLQRGHTPTSDSDDRLSDAALQDLIQQIPIDQLHDEVRRHFIDRVIASDDTPYDETDRDMLQAALIDDTTTVSEVLSPVQNTAETDEDTTDPDQDSSEAPTDSPVDDSDSDSDAPSDDTPDEPDDDQDGLPTGPPTPSDSHDLTAPPSASPPNNPTSTTASQSHSSSPDQETDTTATGAVREEPSPATDDAIYDEIVETLPTRAEATISVTDAISMEKRKECHFLVLDQLTDTQVAAVAPHYGLPSDLAPEAIKTELVQTHAQREVDENGDAADVEPVRHLINTLPIDAPAEANRDATQEASEGRAFPTEIADLDIKISISDPVALEERVQCHQEVLESLDEAHQDRLLATACDAVGWPGDSDAELSTLASAYAETEVERAGETADINPSHLIETHYPGGETGASR